MLSSTVHQLLPFKHHVLLFPLSDASSEYLSTVDLTDSEDAGRNGSAVDLHRSGPHVSVVGGSYSGLSPMIIMNNFVLKQVKAKQCLFAAAYVYICLLCLG